MDEARLMRATSTPNESRGLSLRATAESQRSLLVSERHPTLWDQIHLSIHIQRLGGVSGLLTWMCQ